MRACRDLDVMEVLLYYAQVSGDFPLGGTEETEKGSLKALIFRLAQLIRLIIMRQVPRRCRDPTNMNSISNTF